MRILRVARFIIAKQDVEPFELVESRNTQHRTSTQKKKKIEEEWKTNQVFVKQMEKLPTWKLRAHIFGWLLTIKTNWDGVYFC